MDMLTHSSILRRKRRGIRPAELIKTISKTPITSVSNTGLTKIKGGNRVLMPGLIDNHVHIVMSASTLADLHNPKISEEALQSRATEEAKQMLLRGFTTV